MNPVKIKQIRKLVVDGDIPEALNACDAEGNIAHIIGLKSRLTILGQKEAQGILSDDEVRIETNKIVTSLLGWLDHTEEEEEEEEEEVQNKTNIDLKLIQVMESKLRETLKTFYLVLGSLILFGVVITVVFIQFGIGFELIILGCAIILAACIFPVAQIIKRRDRISILIVISLKPNLSEREISLINGLFLGKNSGLSF